MFLLLLRSWLGGVLRFYILVSEEPLAAQMMCTSLPPVSRERRKGQFLECRHNQCKSHNLVVPCTSITDSASVAEDGNPSMGP